MLRSTPRKTPDKSRQFSSTKSNTPNHNNSLTNSLYFCHYRNAMYMGGIKSFQKHGFGILLHDNGISAITSYHNDLLHGHNIFFTDRCLISAEYMKGKLTELVYRTDGFLLNLNYSSDLQLDGKCLLLNYVTKTIISAVFKKGIIVDKRQEKDFTMLNRVFDLGNLQSLIGKKHARVLSYQIDKVANISANKIGNKLVVGFTKNSLLNGLSFSFIIRGVTGGYNPDTHRNQDDFELKLIERGYYVNSQLHGLGEKCFKNGNLYIGEFKNNVFQGNGILKNAMKKNWVSGYFQKGNLADLSDYSNEGEDKKCQKLIESFHQRKTNWINNEIILVSIENYDKEIQKIMSSNTNAQIKSLQQRKQEVLKKIQQNFINDFRQEQQITSSRNKAMYPESNSKKPDDREVTRKFIRSFIPEGEQSQSNRYNPLSKQQNNQLHQQLKQVPSTSRKSGLRKNHLFENRDNNKSVDSVIKLYKIPINQNKKSEKLKNSIFKPNTARSRQSQAYDNIHQSRIESSPRGSIKPLDSKRIIGRSRIFKYLQNQPQEQPPKFTYKLVKDESNNKQVAKGSKYSQQYIS